MDDFEGRIIAMLPRLRRFARALSGEGADADDLVQAAIERALVHRAQWRPGTSLEAWMFRIVKNAWIDETRARGRRRTVADDADEAAAVPDPANSGAAAPDARLAMRRAVAALPEEQRMAVALILVEGLSYQEAADVLETPVGTVTSRLGRARAALQEQLGHLAKYG